MVNEIQAKAEELQMIVFKLGEEDYTVPIGSVQEIIMPQKTTHIPNAPAFIEGVVNLRGNIIPIIDGRKKFNIVDDSSSSEKRVIVLDFDKHFIGLIVDSVSEVVNLKPESIEKSPVGQDENDFIKGIGKYKDQLLILLDPSNFLDMKESESIQNTLQIAKKMVNKEKN